MRNTGQSVGHARAGLLAPDGETGASKAGAWLRAPVYT